MAGDITTQGNPLNAGFPSSPQVSMDPVFEKPAEAEAVQTGPEQTGRQDTFLNGVPFMAGMPGMPTSMLGGGAFYGSLPTGNGSPFYNGWGSIAVNPYGIPLGSFANYWLMERNPTVALAEATADAPITAAEITYESRPDTDPDRVKFIKDVMETWERFLLQHCTRARAVGFQAFELVYKLDRKGRLVLDKPKVLSPELTLARRDKYGNLVGLHNNGVNIDDERRFLWISYDGKGTNPYGRSRKENCKKPWLREEALWDLLEYSANIQVRPFGWVMHPYYQEGHQLASQNAKFAANAQTIAQNLASGLWASIPNPFVQWQEEMIQKGINPKDVLPYQIGWYDPKTDSGSGFERLFEVTNQGIVSGILQPPRTLLETTGGTKADASVHTNTAVLVNEIFLSDVCRLISRTIIDTLLVQNFGEDARGSVWWKPSPLVDQQLQFNNDLVKTILGSQIGPMLMKRVVQLANIFEKSGVKITEFDQEELAAEAEKAEAEQRKMELQAKGGKGEEEARKASLAVVSNEPLTDDEHKRRKAFLLALLAFFAWQAAKLSEAPAKGTEPMEADAPEFIVRLTTVLSKGMRAEAVPTGFAAGLSENNTEVFGRLVMEETESAADRLATLISQTTAKNIATALESGKSRMEAVDFVLGRAIEQRASLIEDDATYVGGRIGEVAAAKVENAEVAWFTSDDEKVCGICGPLDAVVVKAGEPFAPGIYLPVRDTHSRCRCKIKRVEAAKGTE